MLNLSSFSSRRSHLDSASYRTLVRIFSLCLDESLNPSQQHTNHPNPNPNPYPSLPADCNEDSKTAEDFGHSGSEKCVSFTGSPQGQVDDRNPNPNLDSDSNANCQLAEELRYREGNEDERLRVDGGIEKGEAFTNSSSFEVSVALKELENDDEWVDMELLEGMVTDWAKLIDGQQNGTSFHSVGDLEVKNQQKIVKFGFEKEEREEIGQEPDISPEVCKSTVLRDGVQNNADEFKTEDSKNEEHDEHCNMEPVEARAFDKSRGVEDIREIGEVKQQETCTNSDPLFECFGVKNIKDGEVDGEDFEEGEIPNDFETLNQSLELVHEPAGHEDKKLEEGSVCESFDKNRNPCYTSPTLHNIHLVDGCRSTKENFLRTSSSCTLISVDSNQGVMAFGDDGCLKPEKKESCSSDANVMSRTVDPDILRLSGENLKNLANKEKEKPVETEVVEVLGKKRRGPLTEEKKAKRKRAKKRKRAQKEREQGVKRLKLQPIVKPKEVKYCNFYLIGRCQQGDSCKFSHDTTPLTKSQPCKYFACDSCLKGDDCPFDHQLSKYPCHNYMSNGMCNRGDSCKFSHKLPVTEGSSPAPVASKADSLISSGQSSLVKQLHRNRTSLGPIDQPKGTVAPNSQFTLHKPSAGNLVNARKEPMRIPNGVRFLSFGKGPAGNAEKQKARAQNQEKLLAAGCKNVFSSTQTLLPVSQREKSMKLSMPVYSDAPTTDANKKESCTSLPSEVSEASKLLEEFLFCGTS